MTTGCIVAAPADDLLLDPLDALLETAQRFHQRHQAVMQRRWDALVRRIGQDGDQFADESRTLGDDDAIFGHQPAQGVDQHRALFHQHLAHR